MGCRLKGFFPPKAGNLSFQVSEKITEMILKQCSSKLEENLCLSRCDSTWVSFSTS